MKKEVVFGQLWASVMFITVGILFLIDEMFVSVKWNRIWPVLLIITGILLIYEATIYNKK